MKKIFATLMVLPLLLSSCININFNGSGKRIRCTGPVETRAFEVEGSFSAIELNGGFDVELVNADSCSVVVTANNDAFEWFEVFTKDNGVLVVQTKDFVNLIAEECDVVITAPVFRSLEVNGAVDLEYTASVSGEPLIVEVNGAGDMEMKNFSGPKLGITVNGAADMDIEQLSVKDLYISINGAGDVKLSGEADNADFSVNGAGSINASALALKNAPSVHKNGFADIKLAQ